MRGSVAKEQLGKLFLSVCFSFVPRSRFFSFFSFFFFCSPAARIAYDSSNLCVDDIDFFGLYDCFPICFLRALEAVHLAPAMKGGAYVQQLYEQVR